LARFTLSSFNAGSIRLVDTAVLSGVGDLTRFTGGFTDGSMYGYLVPGAGNGKVARFDLATFSSVTVIDLMAIDPTLNGFNQAFTDQYRQWAYLVPELHILGSPSPSPGSPSPSPSSTCFGKVVRIRIADPPLVEVPVSVQWTDIHSAIPMADGGISQNAGSTWQSCYASSGRDVVSVQWQFLASGEAFFGLCCGTDCTDPTERGANRCHYAVYMAHGGAANRWYVQDGSSSGQIHIGCDTPDWANDVWLLRQNAAGYIEYLRNGVIFYTSAGTVSSPLRVRFDGGSTTIDGVAGVAYSNATALSSHFSQSSDAYEIYNGYFCIQPSWPFFSSHHRQSRKH
jgi:hypothetical protein